MALHDSDLQAALDGELNSREKARLAVRLEQSTQAQEEFDRLKKVEAALQHLESVNPPPGLRHEVMRQIRLQAALRAPQTKASGWFNSLWSPIRNTRPAFQLGLGFALGVLVLSPLLLRPGSLAVDPGQAVGTLSHPRPDLTRALVIAGPGISGEFSRGLVDGTPCLELRLSSDRPVEARIELGRPVGLLSWESATVAQGALLEPGRFVVKHQGQGSYRWKLTDLAGGWPSTRVVVTSDGIPVFEETAP